ncbi:hypothetical protein OSB04_006559 [Centaurea solstitialis]|uniref:SWIM-type domain-containing protein n=1 Tax=Centaurea solstitialis TaxID=347529 RepID=A0AA38TJX5_9ASTR|nr:hypothetical protein OSB04_006559 [Centaurea solstitialis]
MNEVNEKEEVDVNALDQVSESEDEFDFGFDDEVDEDDSDAKSLDHLSEQEEELVNVRTDKARSKMVPPKKDLPKLGGGIENDTKDDEDLLMGEHDAFMEDLLKALKSGEDVGNEHHAQNEAENVDEGDKYPIHDPSTHWKVKKPMVCNYLSYLLVKDMSLQSSLKSALPIAWAVVNVENKDNWGWFIRLLGEDIDIPDGQGLTLMSDQHKGLIEVVKEVMPYAEHRQCARHIYENFRKAYSGLEFRNLFWKAAKASYPLEFERVMNEIRMFHKGAHDYLIKREPKTWSRAFFDTYSCCEAVENGFSDVFNAILVKVRSKPIITMLEAIRMILMERMARMRNTCESWSLDICPTVIKKLDNAKISQRYWNVLPGGGTTFEVRQGHDAFIVDEALRTCTCRMWQLSGVPCPHAVAAIFYLHKLPEDYVPHWFKRDLYKVTYSYHLQPVQGMNQWAPNPLNKPLPPKPRIMPGRPKKKRKRAAHEPATHVARISRVGAVMTCKKCGGQGHNQRGCKEKGKETAEPSTVDKRKKKEAVDKGKKKEAVDKGKKEAVDKGKGKEAVDKGKKEAVDKGKGKETVDKPTTKGNKKTVGGFMSDARKPFKPPTQQSTQESTQSTEKGRKRKKPQINYGPIRRHAQTRITKINLQKQIPGPGSSSTDPHHVE